MSTYLEFAVQLASQAGQKLYNYFRHEEPLIRGTSKEVKTLYDDISDKLIKHSIEKNWPSHSYLTEETGLVDKNSDYLWIIDPLDGTSNFVNHNPLFSISIALWHKGEPVLGVVEVPVLQERFTAVRDQGAYHHDLIKKTKQRASVSSINELKQSYIVWCEGGESDKTRLLALYNNVYPQVKELRKIGSAAIELAWVALGRAEGYITTQISLWDIAAGVLLVSEAGGKNFHFNGQPYKWNGSRQTLRSKFDIVATNGKINDLFNFKALTKRVS